MTEKTHYRKAFNSPYLSAADIVKPVVLTIQRVELLADKTKKTKDLFNTAFFAEKEIRAGEPLKPMILNATNSKTVKEITGSAFINDWNGVKVTVYVDNKVRFGKDTVEGLRIGKAVAQEKPVITPENASLWTRAIDAYKRDGNFLAVLERAYISEEHMAQIMIELQQAAKTEEPANV